MSAWIFLSLLFSCCISTLLLWYLKNWENLIYLLVKYIVIAQTIYLSSEIDFQTMTYDSWFFCQWSRIETIIQLVQIVFINSWYSHSMWWICYFINCNNSHSLNCMVENSALLHNLVWTHLKWEHLVMETFLLLSLKV